MVGDNKQTFLACDFGLFYAGLMSVLIIFVFLNYDILGWTEVLVVLESFFIFIFLTDDQVTMYTG